MLKLRSVTGVKPTKDAGCQIIASPSKGHIKLTPDAAKALMVGASDRVEIFTDDSTGDIYAVKGIDKGGKLASANATGGGTLTFSSGNSWNTLQGSEAENVHYNIDADAGVWVLLNENGEGEVVEAGTECARCYFKLDFEKRVAKAERKPRAKKSEEAASTRKRYSSYCGRILQ